MISECLGRRSKGLFWTSNFSAFRAWIQLRNYIPELFVQVAAVRFEEGFCALQKEHWQGWEWGACSWGEGCLLHHALEWLQSCAGRVTVLVWADTALSCFISPPSLRKPVQPVDWHHVNRPESRFSGLGVQGTNLCSIPTPWYFILFKVAVGVLFLQLGLKKFSNLLKIAQIVSGKTGLHTQVWAAFLKSALFLLGIFFRAAIPQRITANRLVGVGVLLKGILSPWACRAGWQWQLSHWAASPQFTPSEYFLIVSWREKSGQLVKIKCPKDRSTRPTTTLLRLEAG